MRTIVARPSLGPLTIPFLVLLAFGCADTKPIIGPTSPPVATAVGLSILPLALSLIIGEEAQLTARAFDAKDRWVNASFEWSSADPTIATVGESDGMVTAISVGNTTVSVTAGILRATATVSVQPPSPPAAVSISPAALTLISGDVEQLTARATDAAGRPTYVSFEWSSADPAVATVSKSDGVVTAISVGATTVTAAVGGLHATVAVLVVPTAGSLSGTFAFTRMTWLSATSVNFDVLTFSGADRRPRSLPRPFASIAAPTWSPDGTQLAVEVSHDFFFCPWLEYSSDLYVLDAAAPASSPWRALTANGLSKAPSWSPDGKQIAYLQQPELGSVSNDIYIVDAAGGAPVRVTRAPGWYGRPSWSPDGTRLVFSMYVDGGSDSEIFTVNADGSGLSNVTPGAAWDTEPSWSPDGARLAFVSTRDNPSGTHRYSLFVADIDGSNLKRLTSMDAGAPAWSPDGRQIMFSSGARLYVVNADGSSLAVLTQPPPDSWDSAPVWRR